VLSALRDKPCPCACMLPATQLPVWITHPGLSSDFTTAFLLLLGACLTRISGRQAYCPPGFLARQPPTCACSLLSPKAFQGLSSGSVCSGCVVVCCAGSGVWVAMECCCLAVHIQVAGMCCCKAVQWVGNPGYCLHCWQACWCVLFLLLLCCSADAASSWCCNIQEVTECGGPLVAVACRVLLGVYCSWAYSFDSQP
jgi:hypothetical protein